MDQRITVLLKPSLGRIYRRNATTKPQSVGVIFNQAQEHSIRVTVVTNIFVGGVIVTGPSLEPGTPFNCSPEAFTTEYFDPEPAA